MPQKSALSQLQRNTRGLLAKLTAEIRTRELELTRLKHEHEQLAGFARRFGGTPTARRPPAKSPAAPSAKRGRRVNWTTVLAGLPQEFKASDIRKVRGLKDKRPSELFAGITRWIEAGVVRKKERGVYLKVK